MSPLLFTLVALFGSDAHEVRHRHALPAVVTYADPLTQRCRDELAECQRLGGIAVKALEEKEGLLQKCQEQGPAIVEVEVEVIPAWAWALIGGGAAALVGGVATIAVVAAKR